MTIYTYCQSGHNYGLESLRRSAVIYKRLAHLDPILATADYRAASFAKAELDVKNGVGIDVIENLPNMMLRMDMLIYDSQEASDVMKKHMKEFCSHLYEVGVDIPYDIVDDTYFDKTERKREKCFFFADDDYANEMLEFCADSKKQDMPLLMGHYFFMGNDDKLDPYFSEIIEDEEYIDTIKESKFLLTSSINSCIESLAAGNSPVYFKRTQREHTECLDLIEKYNIPVISGENLNTLVKEFDKIILNYPKTAEVEKYDMSNIVKEIEATVKKYESVIQ